MTRYAIKAGKVWHAAGEDRALLSGSESDVHGPIAVDVSKAAVASRTCTSCSILMFPSPLTVCFSVGVLLKIGSAAGILAPPNSVEADGLWPGFVLAPQYGIFFLPVLFASGGPPRGKDCHRERIRG